MTITTSLSAQSFGTLGNVGDGKFATKVTLAAGTVNVQIEVSVTNGTRPVERKQITVHFCPSSFSINASDAPLELQKSQTLLLEMNGLGVSALRKKQSHQVPGSGYLYFWLDVPTLEHPATVSINVIETP